MKTMDLSIFTALNQTLRHPLWAKVCALATTDPYDLLMYAMMLAVTFWGWSRRLPAERRREIAVFVVYYLFFTICLILHKRALQGWIGWHRPSPTLALDPVFRLSALFPGMEVRDSSSMSFPGDHAAFLCCWMMYMLRRYSRQLQLVTLCVAFVVCMPRLIAGAHWFTDAFIGGLLPAMALSSWAFDTPLATALSGRILSFWQRHLRKAA
jgi:membrane-associated phospholipid phosphatase